MLLFQERVLEIDGELKYNSIESLCYILLYSNNSLPIVKLWTVLRNIVNFAVQVVIVVILSVMIMLSLWLVWYHTGDSGQNLQCTSVCRWRLDGRCSHCEYTWYLFLYITTNLGAHFLLYCLINFILCIKLALMILDSFITPISVALICYCYQTCCSELRHLVVS